MKAKKKTKTLPDTKMKSTKPIVKSDGFKSKFSSALEQLKIHDHLCLIYETRDEQFDAVIPFMRIGLERNEKCVYIADDNTAASIITAMGKGGIDVDRFIKSGALSVISKQDAYLREGYFDPDQMILFLKDAIKSAKAEGYEALRATGEMTWALGTEIGVERLMEYEAKLNYMFGDQDIVAICQYNKKRFSPNIIKDIIYTHPLIVYGKTVCKNFYYIPPDEFLATSDQKTSSEVARLLKNILDREKAELLLEESETKFRSIVDNSVDAILLTIPDGRILSANPAACRMFGRTEEEICKLGRYSIMDASDTRLPDALKEREATGKFHGELTLIYKNGTKFLADVTSTIFKDQDGNKKTSMIIRDISERKKIEKALQLSEEKYLKAFRASPIALTIAGLKDGVLMEANPAFEKITGYSVAESIGKSAQNLNLFPDPHEREHLVNVMKKDGLVRDAEMHLRHKSGEQRIVSCSAEPITIGESEYVLSLTEDITERKRAEEALRKSETELKEAQRVGRLGNWEWDAITDTITWSEEYYHIYGFEPRKKPPGYEEHLKAYTPESAKRLDAAVKHSMQTGEGYELDLEHTFADGTTGWVTARCEAKRDTSGRIVGLRGTATDITGRKRLEKALMTISHYTRSLIEVSLDPLVTISTDGKITDVNHATENVTGITRDQLIGNDFASYFTEPDKARQVYQKVLADGLVKDYPLTIQHISGRTTDVIYNATVYKNEAGEIQGVSAAARDITERKRLDEQLHKLSQAVEQSPVSVVITDLDGKIEYVNPKFTQLTGYTFAEVIGKNPRVLKSGETSPKEYRRLWETITSGNEWRGEFHNKKKSGELYWESASISPIKDASGKITHYVAVKENITEKKLLEAQLLRAQRMESIGTLAGGVAHDLNNVLSPIMLSIELLKKVVHDERNKKMLETLETSAYRGSTIVKQILGFARGVQGESVVIQLRHIIREVTNIMLETFPKTIAVKEEIPKDIWTIIGDPTNLHQLMLNLCINARDAMPNGGIIKIKVENKIIDEHYASMNPQSKPGRFVTLSIEDTGCGMPPDVLEHIFEPFFTTKEIGKGTGLGLSTVHAIVKSHGGFINVYSEVGKGTIFRVYLPASKEISEITQKDTLRDMYLGNGELILVVDDENSILQITKHTLEAYGYQTITASDGAEAVALFASRKAEISLVLTDMLMPILDGPHTILALRKIISNVKIIASSGLSHNGQVVHDKELNVDAFLIKPYDARKLLETVHFVLHKP